MRKRIISAAVSLLILPAMLSGMPRAAAEQETTGLYINEVCTQNKSCFTDSLGKASDWIELYHGGDTDLDISGFGLSDDSNLPMKYVFPAGTVIGRGEYLLIVAAKKGTYTDELNTGFGLSKSGETLILSSPDRQPLQTLEIPALAEDTTYGRSADGQYAVMTPTPAAENHSSPAEPVFSMESGFYSTDAIQELTISSEDEVYYTLDGSDPTASPTAIRYHDAIPMYDRSANENVYSRYQLEEDSPYSITSQWYEANPERFDKATIIRAVAKSADGTCSRVITKTYFVMPEEKLKYYSEIPVISVVTDPDNLFDKDKGIYVAGQQYLDWLNDYEQGEIRSECANFLSTGKEWEREAEVTCFKDGTLGFTQKMGMRLRGASTRNSPAKSFNFYARGKYGDSKLDDPLIDGNVSELNGKPIKRYDSFGLRAVSWIDKLREYAVHSALRGRSALAGYDSGRCMLFLDGELWGMYEITEKASDYYIQSNYGVPAELVTLYKNGVLEAGPEDEPLNLQQLGDYCAEHDLSVQEYYDCVVSAVDTESLIEHYCTGLYIGTWDWPNYNYFLWRYNGEPIDGNPYSDGKWRFGSFDFDYSVGLTYGDFGDGASYEHDSFQKMDGVKDSIPTVIFAKLLENPEFRQQFADSFREYANSVFEASKMTAELNAEEERFMDYMTMTAWRWNNGKPDTDMDSFLEEQKAYYHGAMEEMRVFFQNRAVYAIRNMQNYLGITDNPQAVKGDVNRNGVPEIADAVLCIRLISEDSALDTAGLDFSCCDLNGDAICDLTDARMMLLALQSSAEHDSK